MSIATLHAWTEDSFAGGGSATGRVEHEGDTATWLAGTLVASSVQGHGLLPLQELWVHQNFFFSSLL